MLVRNAGLNELTNLDVHSLGLWHESSARLQLAGFDSFANAVPASDEQSGFQTITIDDYLAGTGRALSVLMLDIEGAEFQALRGARATLERDRPSVVFEVHREYVDWSAGLQATAICRLLIEQGYQLYAVRDFNTNQDMVGRKIELVPVDTVYLEGPPHGFNMLALSPHFSIDPTVFNIVDGVSPKLLWHKDPALHHPLDRERP
jgi:hypothetical protein